MYCLSVRLHDTEKLCSLQEIMADKGKQNKSVTSCFPHDLLLHILPTTKLLITLRETFINV